MIERILNFYNEELKTLQKEAWDFAAKHPEIAGTLNISPESIKDPLVKQLIQSFAFLSAKTRFDFEQAQHKHSLLLTKTLAPQLDYPLASMCVAQFKIKAHSEEKIKIPIDSSFILKNTDNTICEFRNSYEIAVDNLEIKSINYQNNANNAQLSIKIHNPGSNNNSRKLHFFIKGNLDFALNLHQLIFENLEQLTLTQENKDDFVLNAPINLGFADQEVLLPYPKSILRSHRLVQEFLNYPNKFLFFTIDLPAINSNEFSLLFKFSIHKEIVSTNINNQSLALNCGILINLYHQQAEAIRLNSDRTEYPLFINQSARIPQEIYSIEKIHLFNPQGERSELPPKFQHNFRQKNANFSYVYYRKNQHLVLEKNVLRNFNLLSAELLVCNKNYPAEKFNCMSEVIFKDKFLTSIENIKIIKEPTGFQDALLTQEAEQQMTEVLKINHLFSTGFTLDALVNLFQIYNQQNHPYLSKLINNLHSIKINQKWQADLKGNMNLLATTLLSFKEDNSLAYSLFKMLINEIISDYLPLELHIHEQRTD